jgi:hypothetical protein
MLSSFSFSIDYGQSTNRNQKRQTEEKAARQGEVSVSDGRVGKRSIRVGLNGVGRYLSLHRIQAVKQRDFMESKCTSSRG